MKQSEFGSRRDRAMANVLRLREIPIFADLSAEELLPVAAITSERRFAAGDVIFEQDADAQHLYLIVSGRVEVIRGGSRLAVLGSGECFGEMAMLDRTTRSATVRALDETRALTTPRDDFHDLLDVYPEIARGIARVLVGRLREAYARP